MGAFDVINLASTVAGAPEMKNKVQNIYKNQNMNRIGTPMANQNQMDRYKRINSIVPALKTANEFWQNAEKCAGFKDVLDKSLDGIIKYDRGIASDWGSDDPKRKAIGAAKAVPLILMDLAPAIGATITAKQIEKNRVKEARKKGDVTARERKATPYITGAMLGAATLANAAVNGSFLAPARTLAGYAGDNGTKILTGLGKTVASANPAIKSILEGLDPAFNEVDKINKKVVQEKVNQSNKPEWKRKPGYGDYQKPRTSYSDDYNHITDNLGPRPGRFTLSKTPVEDGVLRGTSGLGRTIKRHIDKNAEEMNAVEYKVLEKNAGVMDFIKEKAPKLYTGIPKVNFSPAKLGGYLKKNGGRIIDKGVTKGVTKFLAPVAVALVAKGVNRAGQKLDNGLDKLDERRRQKQLAKDQAAELQKAASDLSEKLAFWNGYERTPDGRPIINLDKNVGKNVAGVTSALITAGTVNALNKAYKGYRQKKKERAVNLRNQQAQVQPSADTDITKAADVIEYTFERI